MEDDKYTPSETYSQFLKPSRPKFDRMLKAFPMPLPEDVTSDAKPETEETTAAPTARRRRELLDATSALARATFEASVPPSLRRQMLQGDGIAIVVTVPSASWVKPIANYLDEIMHASRYARDGSERRDNPEEGNGAVANSLADGGNVVGISQNPKRFLPSLLVASADLHVSVKAPDAKAITRTMRLCLTGRVPADVPSELGAGMDFAEIVAALRKNTKPIEAVRRLKDFAAATVVSDDDGEALPTLQEAEFYGEARDWALDLAKDMADAKRSSDFSSLPRGAVVAGKPGTGKSVFAKLVARACGVPFVNGSMGDFFANSDGYLGGVIKSNRALFARAAALCPCILFIDELDALPNRATLDGRAREWWNTVITDTLTLVSTAPKGIIILGATNYASHLDEALLRPGRMERVFEIGPPKTAEALESVLRFHLQGDLAGEDLLPISRMALGTTPATIMDYVRTARRKAKTAGRDMTLPDLAEVMCPPDTRTPAEQCRTAVHEAAHIVIAIVVGITTVRSASIVACGDTAGRVAIDGIGELLVGGRDQVEAIVSVLLAGRCAEVAFMNGPTGGAGGHPSSDLAHATRLVAAMHGSLGLAGKATYRGALEDLGTVMSFDAQFRTGVEEHLSMLTGKTELLVRQYRAEIMRVADLLMERRYVSADDVRAVMGAKMRALPSPAT